MPLIATQTIDEDGLDATYSSADVGGDTFVNDTKTFLHLKNGDASPTTVTVAAAVSTTQKPGFGELSKADAQVVVGATDEAFLGPFPASAFGPTPGIAYSSITSLTLAVLRT